MTVFESFILVYIRLHVFVYAIRMLYVPIL